jgi:HlyD family secretion protein
MKEVELGLNSDAYVEIKSGLSEGDIVVLPPLVTNSSTSSTANTQGGGFNLGGMGGGMPGGGMQPPSGSGTNFGNRQASTQRK